MRQKLLILLFVFGCYQKSHAQKDTSSVITDTSIDYDLLFNELDNFLDSLLKPRSYTLVNLSAGTSIMSYASESSYNLQSNRQFMLSPTLGYFDKSGLGVSASAAMIADKDGVNPYQYTTTVSYDYLKNLNFITGIAATHFFTRDSLSFYTSPLKNEVSTFFSYRKLWFKPSVSASYGWGTKNSFTEQEEYITSLRLRRKGYTQVNTHESISDFNLMLAVRHDFYWLNVLTKKDFVRLTPQLNFTSGTQTYGFNQTSNSYGSQRIIGGSQLYRSENVYLDDHTNFRPLSVAALLKSELSIGKFFIQPQAIFNYYIPATENNLTTTFLINTGFIF